MEGKVTTGKTYNEMEHKQSGQTVSTEYEEKLLDPVILSPDHATVEAKLGMTLSLGNFEFLRADAGITLPCEKSEINEAYEKAFGIVSKELFERIAEAKESLPK